jgi:protein-tyrosine phosphatase
VSTPNGQNKVNVLFVCLGNICRSPMAEAVFRDLVKQAGLAGRFEITSAGIGDWHAGEPPHRGTRETLKRHDIESGGLMAKCVSQPMLDRADYVVAMDDEIWPICARGGSTARKSRAFSTTRRMWKRATSPILTLTVALSWSINW